jgi:hypothetical protein
LLRACWAVWGGTRGRYATRQMKQYQLQEQKKQEDVQMHAWLSQNYPILIPSFLIVLAMVQNWEGKAELKAQIGKVEAAVDLIRHDLITFHHELGRHDEAIETLKQAKR